MANGQTSPKNKTAELSEGSLFSRRDFLSKFGWYVFWGIIGIWTLSLVRFMFPRVLFEPSTIFKAGYPEEYPEGTVSTRWVGEKRVWIVRESGGFFALLAICTHLGCTPIWLESENKFKCPCHGSGFHRDGINFEGPAPRALNRTQIAFTDDGQLLIDKGKLFQYERGGWENPDAFLKYIG